MDPKDAKFEEMRLLICELVDGAITPDRMARLNQILANNPEAVNHYIDFLDIQVLIQSNMSNMQSDVSAPVYSDESRKLSELWRQLAEEEKTAPEIEIPKEQPRQTLIQKVVYPPRQKRKATKLSIAFLTMNAAAILFFFLFLKFAPHWGGVKVATVTDSLNARWANANGQMENGTSLQTGNKSLWLHEGYAELLFENQTKVTIEGPAEFQILTEDQIKLSYGSLYVMVPREAIGFTIKTPFSQIIDLGTEFGVRADLQGDTSLHVTKGKTVLIAGEKSTKKTVEVTEGAAKKVSGQSQAISDISYNDRLFAREINSAANVIWRGQMEIDLADIVGGGNGFGTGRLNHGIMMDTGKLSAGPLFIGDYNIHYKSPRNSFRPVPESAAVDGIFVPDGRNGEVLVSSQGHLFEGCPQTTSTWCVPIINGAQYKSDSDVRFRIKEQTYGTSENPGLFMHANAGITYDLNVIRGMLPAGKSLTRFASIGAVLDVAPYGQPGLADVWILVDGQVRFSKTNVTSSESFQIDIPLRGENRFLSLVVTDGVDDKTDAKRNKDGFDWFLFGTPKLMIE
jgi:hypothetical protein